jgi:hypothetical protein
MFVGDIVAKKKPTPDFYIMAVNQSGLGKAKKCVIFKESAIGFGSAVVAEKVECRSRCFVEQTWSLKHFSQVKHPASLVVSSQELDKAGALHL